MAISIYKELKNSKEYGLKDQIQRAAISVPSNIAEGFERQTNKDFIRFLYYSKASSGELRTQLYLCMELGIIPIEKCQVLFRRSKKISRMIHNLIKTRNEQFT